MSTTLQAIVAGTTYDLGDTTNYMHLDNNGFGLPPQRMLTESGPLQHGVSYLGFRLEPRVITLSLFTLTATEDAYYSRRDELLSIFKPSNSSIKLRFTKSNGDVRQIDAYYNGGLDLSSDDRYYTNQKVAVQLYAPDPIWYDPTQLAVRYNVSAGSGSFAFPLSFPVSFGGSTVNQTRTIQYDGSWTEYPTVIIYGPITSPVVTNLTTGDKLDFTGTTINSGDYYTIDTRFGYKTVTDSSGTNQISKLTSDSDLTTFSLLADPDAVGGNNDIHVTGTSANAVTEIYLRYYNRYIGL